MQKRTRKTKGQLLAWMEKHAAVWEGFPKAEPFSVSKSHAKKVFEALQRGRMFSKATAFDYGTVDRLVSHARFVRRMKQLQPEPEKN